MVIFISIKEWPIARKARPKIDSSLSTATKSIRKFAREYFFTKQLLHPPKKKPRTFVRGFEIISRRKAAPTLGTISSRLRQWLSELHPSGCRHRAEA